MPGVFETNSPANTWMPSSLLMYAKWSEANQPIVYAPNA